MAGRHFCGPFRVRSKASTNPLEAAAKAKGLNYVKLDGEVGIIGNGAGLVMSALDVVAYAGEAHSNVKPANFLEVGKTPTETAKLARELLAG